MTGLHGQLARQKPLSKIQGVINFVAYYVSKASNCNLTPQLYSMTGLHGQPVSCRIANKNASVCLLWHPLRYPSSLSLKPSSATYIIESIFLTWFSFIHHRKLVSSLFFLFCFLVLLWHSYQFQKYYCHVITCLSTPTPSKGPFLHHSPASEVCIRHWTVLGPSSEEGTDLLLEHFAGAQQHLF